jgi:hypothetical protein
MQIGAQVVKPFVPSPPWSGVVDEATVLLVPPAEPVTQWFRPSAVFPSHGPCARVGMIPVNSHNVRRLLTPFGAMKRSGVGRDCGEYSFDFYIEPRIRLSPTATTRPPD